MHVATLKRKSAMVKQARTTRDEVKGPVVYNRGEILKYIPEFAGKQAAVITEEGGSVVVRIMPLEQLKDEWNVQEVYLEVLPPPAPSIQTTGEINIIHRNCVQEPEEQDFPILTARAKDLEELEPVETLLPKKKKYVPPTKTDLSKSAED